MTQRSRNYCFTLNNYKETDVDCISNIQGYKYLIIGHEIGAKGTPHLQGYIMFKNARNYESVKNYIKRWHVEIAKGSPHENFVYCSKDNKYTEFGERPKGQGFRSDIDHIKSLVKSNTSIKEIYENCNSYQALRFAEKGLELYSAKRNWKPKVFWYYGSTGTGKTKRALEECPEAWISGRNLKWWQGYECQTEVIIDDFRKDFCTFHELLRILDRYPYTVEIKGGSRQLLAKVIIITSPYDPWHTYETREDIGQLIRRIDKIINFDTDTEVGGNTDPTCVMLNSDDEIEI